VKDELSPGILNITGLRAYLADSGKPLLRDVGFRVGEGELVGLLGQSGSGKSLTALAAAGLLPGSIKAEGSIVLAGHEIIGAEEGSLNRIRGRDISIVFQEPSAALDPLMRIERQIALPLKKHSSLRGAELRERVYSLLEEVKLTEIRRIARSLPQEISGGQRQRAALALALAASPRLLIADEPTSSVDASVQKQLIELIQETARARGMAVLFISHDIAAVRKIAERILVMKDGRIVESGNTRDVISSPRHRYTRLLLHCERELAYPETGGAAVGGGIRGDPERGKKIFELSGVSFAYKKKEVLKNVSLAITEGESLGIVGESGSGKTTLLSMLLRLAKPQSGRVSFYGQGLGEIRGRGLRDFRARVQPVFQDPFLSLDPVQKVEGIIAEPLVSLGLAGTREERKERILRVLEKVGLEKDALGRRPPEFSGGQRQRIAIARALVTNPEALIADESVSALDIVTKVEILSLLRELKEKGNFTLVFVSHDLQAVADISERIVMLNQGTLVESDLTPDEDAPYGEYVKKFQEPGAKSSVLK
jgi:ABC-type glutathione transport system ATPase component